MPFKPVVLVDKGESVVVGVVVAEVGVGEVRGVESSGEHLIAASKEGEAGAGVAVNPMLMSLGGMSAVQSTPPRTTSP